MVRPHRLDLRICSSATPAWRAIEQAEPEFAARVRSLFDAGRHKTIATLRADGSPRISGLESVFTDGDLRKITGRAIPATRDAAAEQPDGEMFIADITEVVITGLTAAATRLDVESWAPERGLRRVERD